MTSPGTVPRGIYIDGTWRQGPQRTTRHDRWTGAAFAELELGGADEARTSVDAAQRGFEIGLGVPERSDVLARVSRIVAARAEEFATAISRETGKPISAARGEVGRAVETFRYSSEEARRLPGERVPLEAVPSGQGMLAVTVPEARGIVAAITPFNFPINLVAHKVGPALAAGCPVVLKPSDKATVAAVLLTEVFEEAGLPAGWLNVVNGPAEPIVGAWLDDDRVAVVNFTGSAQIGWDLKARSAHKVHILELGSNTAMYVHREADLPRAAADAVTAGFANSGQACISLQRLYVDEAVAGQFLPLLTQAVAAVPAGDPADEGTVVGPLVTDQAASRVIAWVDEARAAGAKVLVGGTGDHRSVAPTVVVNPPEGGSLVIDEVFGPVVSAIVVRDLDDAVRRVNDSRYGLNASIYTRDLAAGLSFSEKVRAGSVLVNIPPSFRADHMPYGGVKDSGQGREGIRYAVAELVEMKLVVIKA